ncbi:LysR family transcriptional regulator [Streptomyces parvus]|uniref:LysR family transcriptional regulator n=1 Tax=Streptomyces TaxID=1883 RepID=UPI000B5138A6|nr:MULTISPECIES: LysR family transcriptional regulator [unclassified Streptomyces]MYX00919.1 LysR family transcriptional regulator [Streptomyces sp. SID8378]SNB90571.1 DNA-binding transcriptional regulator, LysR family [Streptomyces sp. PgraA7]
MSNFTLHELQCFNAVVRGGGFQAAAELLHRSHPSVFASVAKLERQLGLELLDRSGYRVQLTEAGRAFHRKVRVLLHEAEELGTYAAQLAMGEESELRVVLGDLCPLPPVLEILSSFFAQRPQTRLHLLFETVTGPWERLLEDEADLIVHRVPKSDVRMEWIDLGRVALVPVVAPGFLPFPLDTDITPQRMQALTQCVVRDSSRHPSEPGHFLIEGAPRTSVPDHLMKKELILHGMAWGHVPRFMIETELRNGSLLSIAGQHFPGVVEELSAARRRDRPHGPVADQLWDFLARHAAVLKPALGRVPGAKKAPERDG